MNKLHSNSFTKSSFSFLVQNPILIMIACIKFIVTLIIFLAIGFALISFFQALNQPNPVWVVIAVITFYILISCIATYFNAIIVAISLKRLAGEPASLAYGLQQTNRNKWYLLKWALLGRATTLYVVFKDRPVTLGKIFDNIISIGLDAALYFVLPSILYENIAPTLAIKRQSQILGNNVRANLIVSFGVNFSFAFSMNIIFVFLATWLFYSFPGMYASIFLAAWLTVNIIIISLLDNISKSALYLYYTQNIKPKGFDASLLDSFFYLK